MKQCITIILLLLAQLGFGQKSNIHLTGQLKDAINQEPIPYASIVVTGTTLGTACNPKGMFELSIPGEWAHTSIRVSCIGYISKTFSLDSIATNKDLMLFLSQDSTLLDEISIESTISSPTEILDEALNAVSKNYYQ